MQAFLEVVNFYRRFVQTAKILWPPPLSDLMMAGTHSKTGDPAGECGSGAVRGGGGGERNGHLSMTVYV